jgi:hypothetical protein
MGEHFTGTDDSCAAVSQARAVQVKRSTQPTSAGESSKFILPGTPSFIAVKHATSCLEFAQIVAHQCCIQSQGRLSQLSAWWVRLGILPQLIEPGKPQQNGRHERMHRTLKAETTRPPSANHIAQQRRFNRFRAEFNEQRPHELDLQTPALIYAASPREMPSKLPPLEYPDRFELRYVSANGGIRWNCAWVNVSHVCMGEYVGLEEIDSGVWNVYFGPVKLGRFLERHMRIEDAYGRLKRQNR